MLRWAIITCLVSNLCGDACAMEPHLKASWSRLPDLPDRFGFAGPILGTIDSSLIAAGGANFPNLPPWEGGKKIWHTGVYRLRPSADQWEKIGELPYALGYAVSGSHQGSLIFAGGSDAERHYARVWRMTLRDDRPAFQELASLPHPLANAAGGILGDTLIVSCGSREPGEKEAENRTFSLNLVDPAAKWQELERHPGPARILPAVGFADGSLFLFGGAALERDEPSNSVKRRYLSDAWRLRPGAKWERLADVPARTVASPSPLPLLNGKHFVLLGGDDGSRVGFQPVQEHPGFSKRVFMYEVAANRWQESTAAPIARVTTTIVPWQGMFVLPSGEVRPGVRSPEVHAIKFE